METGIVDLISFDGDFAWRHWAVWYFLLIGSASAAALIGFMSAWKNDNAPQVRPALFAAAVCGITAPFPLLADLHQPARFINFYFGAATDSIMWWGAWFLPSFVIGLVALVLLYSPYGIRFIAYRRYAWSWTALFAVTILAYTAGEMTIVQARPVWNHFLFPVLLTLSAFVSGAGIIAITATIRGQNSGIAPRMVGLGSLLFVVGVLFWIAIGWGNNNTFAELALKQAPISLLLYMTGICGFGGAILSFTPQRPAFLSILAGVLAVLGALIFRWNVFMGGQAQLKTETLPLSYSFLTNSDALAGLIGTAGLLAMVAVILSLILGCDGKDENNHAPSQTAL